MATTLHIPPEHLTDSPLGFVPSHSAAEFFARGLPVTQLDLKDTRYPTLPKAAAPPVMPSSYADRDVDATQAESSRRTWADPLNSSCAPSGWFPNNSSDDVPVIGQQPQFQDTRASPAHPSQPRSHPTPAVSKHPPPEEISGSFPVSRSPEEQRAQRMSSNSGGSASPAESNRAAFMKSVDSPVLQQTSPDNMGQRLSTIDQYRDRSSSLMPSTPRHPSLPLSGIAGPSTSTLSPIVPLSAGPSYNPASMIVSISPKPRAFPQQPTFINLSATTPAFAPPQVSKEEVCLECAMRDQEMADVDVTSPGAWERESDALYEDLCRREMDEEGTGKSSSSHSSRPRARGGFLTESNLKLWLSVNPKEPSSRMQTLDQYVRAQRALLEFEAIAHSRAMRESRQLDDRMRDAYSQLRRSAYELGSSPVLTDDSGGVRVKVPTSPSVPSGLTHGRDVTLLENGMIVEHVDMRKEERERKKEERRERSRARKSSRSSRSGIDVMSVYSLPSQPHPTDSGFFSGLRSDSRFSQSMSARPSSVLTGGNDRPLTMLRAQSQASFTDLQSVGSTSSPRRSKFFGLKNLSTGWRSQDSLAPSGSMIDMHVALQREQQFLAAHPGIDLSSNAPTLRLSESWNQSDVQQPDANSARAAKKSNGLKKIWKLVTGSSSKSVASAHQSRSLERQEDDGPLAPPPPLSFLVNGAARARHISTPSLPSSTASPNGFIPYGSSPTAPSSCIPSPISSRPSGVDKDAIHETLSYRPNFESTGVEHDDRIPSGEYVFPESDSRTRSSSRTLSSVNGPLTPATSPSQRPVSTMLSREKSLPPLPGESSVEFPNHMTLDTRPQTVFTYDPNCLSAGGFTPPQAAFRHADARRQSFGGVGSRPVHPSSMSTTNGPRQYTTMPPFLAQQEKFNEFGAQMSISQWSPGQYSQPSLSTPLSEKPKKRKSKFGLGLIFGRKSVHGHGSDGTVIADTLEFPAFRTSHSDYPYDGYVNGNGGPPASGHISPVSTYAYPNASAPRLSVMSRRNLDLVDQDPEFVAYRYPSTDQRLDLAR